MAATTSSERAPLESISPEPVGPQTDSAVHSVLIRIVAALLRPWLLRPLSVAFRRCAPIAIFGRWAVVTRYLDVIEVLRRENDFVASPIYGPNIDALDGPFILGLDRGPQYERELAVLQGVLRRDDLDRVGQLAAAEAARQIELRRHLDETKPHRQIDVGAYARAVAMRVVSDYFGVRGPRDEIGLWLRDIFVDIFVNPLRDASLHRRASSSSTALGRHIDGLIAERRAALQAGAPADGATDDVLGRLLSFSAQNPWFDDRSVRRNMIGMIAGTVDNMSTLLVLAYAQLLRRPDAAAHARVAALAGDSATVRRYIFEAARFDPPMPVLPRVALRTTKLAEGTSRERLIPAGTLLLLGNISALHDPDGFDQPGTFDIDHDAGRLLFGAGFHRCLGYEINGIVIPQLAAALLRLKKSRFAPGADGRVQFNGMLANRLMLDFA